MPKLHTLLLGGALAGGLAGCGQTQGESVLSGAGLGAAGGEAAGAPTSPRDVDLGRPAWR